MEKFNLVFSKFTLDKRINIKSLKFRKLIKT